MYASHPPAGFTCTKNGLSSSETSLYTSKLKIIEINITQILNSIMKRLLRKKNDWAKFRLAARAKTFNDTKLMHQL